MDIGIKCLFPKAVLKDPSP